MTRIVCNGESEALMVHHASGRVEWVGFWGAMQLLWRLVRARRPVVVVDAASGEEIAL